MSALGNRYNDLLEQYNDQILENFTGLKILRGMTVRAVKRHFKSCDTILEIGCGDGASALPLLEALPGVRMDLLDVSHEMLEKARANLVAYADRISFHPEEANSLRFLNAQVKTYPIITSSWTIHNFPQDGKRDMLQAIARALKPGGTFVLMDRVYPDVGGRALLDAQLDRYRDAAERGIMYKPASDAIVAHELDDYADIYRQEETPFIALMREAGFVKIVCEREGLRDAVITAHI